MRAKLCKISVLVNLHATGEAMEISTATLAAREAALNKANVGRDILQRTQEEQEEAVKTQREEIPAEVRKVEPDKQGGIDFYA